MIFKREKDLKIISVEEMAHALDLEEKRRFKKESKWSEHKIKRFHQVKDLKYRKRAAKEELKYQRKLFRFLVNRSDTIVVTSPHILDDTCQWADVHAKFGKKLVFLFTLYTFEDWCNYCEEGKTFFDTYEVGSEDIVMYKNKIRITSEEIIENTHYWFKNYYERYYSEDLKIIFNKETWSK